MPLFSECNGYSAPIGLQYETISDDLRKDIYKTLYLTFQKYDPDTYQEDIYQYVWIRLWHNPIDEFPSRYYNFYPFLKKWINECKWYEVYDLIEMIVKCFNENDESPLPFQADYETDYVSREDYQQNINNTLEYGQAGYRLIDKYIYQLLMN